MPEGQGFSYAKEYVFLDEREQLVSIVGEDKEVVLSMNPVVPHMSAERCRRSHLGMRYPVIHLTAKIGTNPIPFP